MMLIILPVFIAIYVTIAILAIYPGWRYLLLIVIRDILQPTNALQVKPLNRFYCLLIFMANLLSL